MSKERELDIEYYNAAQACRIKNFFDDDELSLIWKELDFLNSSDALMSPVETGSARDENGNITKKNKGVFLDELYSHNRRFSNILKLTTKIFDKDLVDGLIQLDKNFTHIRNSTQDSTLLSYYEKSDHYKKHFDNSVITVLFYFCKQPKAFHGGNLILSDYDIEIECENNMLLFIPGYVLHEVEEVHMKDEDLNKGLGRYCISKFILYRSDK